MSTRISPQNLFIHRGLEFSRIKQEGKRVTTRFFNLVISPNPVQQGKVGIVVSRRLGKAVIRNRAKRIFRELVRGSFKKTPPSKECIIFPRRASLTVKHQTLRKTWTTTLAHEEICVTPTEGICAN